MNYTHILVRYGELTTKGTNKIDFINKLFRNIKSSLKEIGDFNYQKTHDRIYIELNGQNTKELTSRLENISGISSFSYANKLENEEVETIYDEALKQANQYQEGTFKVVVRRANKRFPINSDQLVRQIASHILKNTNFKVDIHEPSFYLRVEIRNEGIFVFTDVIKGSGGYPLGTQSKALMLMSGGIDSPVAAYLMMKRGVKIEAIHFASPPYTSELALEKVKDLLYNLTSIQEAIPLHIINFTKLQEAIYQNCDESYAITIMRRMMYRISEKIATKSHCVILGSGESIGQVASQTLESMATINEVIKMPMMRPLAIYDKLDIIEIAKKIKTYEISIRPHIDCCTIFTPVNPSTKPTIKKALFNEAKFNFEELINECVDNEEIILIRKDFLKNEINEYL